MAQKVLLICDNDTTIQKFKSFCEAEKGFLVVYHLPLKALDNILEIMPDILAIDATDFPRHWKLIFQCLNLEFSELKIKKILVVNQNFPKDEIKKAEFLQTDLLLNQNLQNLKIN